MTINRQNAFNLAVTGLLAQGRKAMNDGACVYLDPKGNRCAVGMMIDPERYDPKVEGGGVMNRAGSLNTMLVPEVGTMVTDDDLDFMAELQAALHDRLGDIIDPELPRDVLIARAKRMAETYNLTLPEGVE